MLVIYFIIFFLAYIIVGSVVTVLATYVSDSIEWDVTSDPMMMLLVMVWPFSSLPLLIFGVVRKLLDFIFKD